MRCRSIYISDEFCVVRVRGQKFVRNQPIHHCAQAYFTWKIQWKQFSQINFVVFQFWLPTPYFSLSLSPLPPLFLWSGSLYWADSSEAVDWQSVPLYIQFPLQHKQQRRSWYLWPNTSSAEYHLRMNYEHFYSGKKIVQQKINSRALEPSKYE